LFGEAVSSSPETCDRIVGGPHGSGLASPSAASVHRHARARHCRPCSRGSRQAAAGSHDPRARDDVARAVVRRRRGARRWRGVCLRLQVRPGQVPRRTAQLYRMLVDRAHEPSVLAIRRRETEARIQLRGQPEGATTTAASTASCAAASCAAASCTAAAGTEQADLRHRLPVRPEQLPARSEELQRVLVVRALEYGLQTESGRGGPLRVVVRPGRISQLSTGAVVLADDAEDASRFATC
jgi:hypothetical protein